ncbi:hypothetical protein CROQUDRAFT_689249 [Cronartium quercuum f. sp. fusiforme G11]|uniref:Uncharacterized protein n=1 Tax=Cronartium quercuum f. sp. fusiforme G11 TaxID=708437 RepID=A0A9P6NBH2_9BASI|nr:hypothetical protein CROQUDRAFT_689249 [Cronartium quercuum f. sp. fusiforme G11]
MVDSAWIKFYQRSEFRSSGLEKDTHRFPQDQIVAYRAIKGEDLIQQKPSLFEGKYDILKTNKNRLEVVLNEKIPVYDSEKDISVAGWPQSRGEEIGTKDEFFESALTYFVELMKQWFSEYEAILKEVRQGLDWKELYSNRVKFCVEFLEIAPGLIVHHLEFGNSVPNLQSLSWALVFKWLHQYSATLHNIVNNHSTSPQGGLLLKKAYFKAAIHSIEGDRQSYHISLLKTKKVGDFQATTFRVPSLPYLKLY